MSLSGKVAVVTGASRGIGRAIARRLAADGALVVVHFAANGAAAGGTVAEIIGAGGRAFAYQADLAEPTALRGFWTGLDPLLQQHAGAPRCDILVNNAGIGGAMKTIEQVSEAELDRMLLVNLKAPFLLIQGAIPRLRDGGRIVNISSMGTRAAFPGMAAYAPAKAGLEALSVLLAQQLGARGITVNAVLPGATATDMNPRASDPEQARQTALGIALGRVGQPEDVADVVGLLCSEHGRWITGQRIDASGGQRL